MISQIRKDKIALIKEAHSKKLEAKTAPPEEPKPSNSSVSGERKSGRKKSRQIFGQMIQRWQESKPLESDEAKEFVENITADQDGALVFLMRLHSMFQNGRTNSRRSGKSLSRSRTSDPGKSSVIDLRQVQVFNFGRN